MHGTGRLIVTSQTLRLPSHNAWHRLPHCDLTNFATCSATARARQGGTLTYLKFAGAPTVLYASGWAHFVWINELRRRPLLDPAVNVLRWGRGHMGMPSVPRTFCQMSGLLVLPTLLVSWDCPTCLCGCRGHEFSTVPRQQLWLRCTFPHGGKMLAR